MADNIVLAQGLASIMEKELRSGLKYMQRLQHLSDTDINDPRILSLSLSDVTAEVTDWSEHSVSLVIHAHWHLDSQDSSTST